jgi:hypothetical protein
MRLEAVRARRGRAVVADRDGQEVELDVGILDACARADEAAGLELVRRPQPPARKQPLRADPGLAPEAPVGIEADGLLRGILDVELEVVLEVPPHARTIRDHGNSLLHQVLAGANSTQHENFRRIDRACGEDHLRPRAEELPAREAHACGAAILDLDPLDETAYDARLARRHGGAQIGVGRRPAPALPDRALEGAEALLPLAVVVVRHAIARRGARVDKRLEQRVFPLAPRDVQRPLEPAPRGLARVAVPALHPPEVGQDVGIAPAVGAHLGPGVEVAGMAAHVDHAVDRGGAADHLAARAGHAPPAHVRLGLGAVAPVVAAHVHRVGECAGHPDEGARVAAAMLDHEDGAPRLGQAEGHGAAGRARADDDVIGLHHAAPPPVDGRSIPIQALAKAA